MFAVVYHQELLDCVVLRADTQSFEAVGRYPTVQDCFQATAQGDDNILLIASRERALELTRTLDNMTELDGEGRRTYFWMDHNTKIIQRLGMFHSYPDAIHEARRRNIQSKTGIVFDEQKRKLWSLQVRPIRETVH